MKKTLKRLLERLLRRHGYALTPLYELADPLGASALRLRLFRQLARRGFAPTHLVDVGAHTADWSRDFRTVFPACAFTLIEPQRELEPHLARFCAAGKARYLIAGAGAKAGELPFTVGPRADSSSFLVSEEEARAQGLERRVVPVVTLDAVCAEPGWPVPEVVKIDAEGFELAVLAGATTLLGVTELIFAEVAFVDWPGHPTLHETFGYLRERGYEPFDFTDLNRHPGDGTLILAEVAFARRDGLVRG